MTGWTDTALGLIGQGEPIALVTLLAVEGSAPREAGARMLVWGAGQQGTIGGGNLEYQAAAQGRRLLEAAAAWAVQDYPLGPLLGQCCGGRVRLVIERLGADDGAWLETARQGGSLAISTRLGFGEARRSVAARGVPGEPGPLVNDQPAEARGAKPGPGDEIVRDLDTPPPRLRLFGAGHVGRAVASVLRPLPFRLEWYDSRPEVAVETGARCLPPEALREVAAAPAPYTVVLTHDHALDYALVSAALNGCDAGYLGLIGSKTKRARFFSRLRADGIDDTRLARLTCPIGLPTLLNKAPEVIAISVAADLLIRLQASESAPGGASELAGV
jgi:xanthine dehydrogenase accessory factor